jgi:AraC-like DNA-binding protein
MSERDLRRRLWTSASGYSGFHYNLAVSDDLTVSISSTGMARYPAGATFGPRRMRDWEFVWIIEGDAVYSRDDAGGDPTHEAAQHHQAPAGSIVLCRPNGTDFFRWDPRRPTRHGYFHFDVTGIPAGWPGSSTWPSVRVPGDGDVLRPLFRHLLTWAGQGDPALCALTVRHMLTAFVTNQFATRDAPRDSLPEAVERAFVFVQQTLDRDPAAALTLNALAEAACVSPEHLCRMFKLATDHSPLETVRLARLDRAAVLLARSNYSISRVAELCGFSSPFHFSRRFREAFGKSPTQLRKGLANGETPPTPRLAMRVDSLG